MAIDAVCTCLPVQSHSDLDGQMLSSRSCCILVDVSDTFFACVMSTIKANFSPTILIFKADPIDIIYWARFAKQYFNILREHKNVLLSEFMNFLSTV